METDKEKLPLIATKGTDIGLKEISSHIVVDLAFLRTHSVLEQKCSAVNKGFVQELLGLATKRALANAADASPQLMGLVDHERPIVTVAEHLAEGCEVSKQSTRWLDPLR